MRILQVSTTQEIEPRFTDGPPIDGVDDEQERQKRLQRMVSIWMPILAVLVIIVVSGIIALKDRFFGL